MKLHCKIISALITFSLIVSLAACGSENISGNVVTPETKADTSGTIDKSSEPVEETYEIGSTDGGIYTNDFVGIGCELDENWTFFDEKQLSELNGVLVDALDDKELAEQYTKSMESGKTIYDMCTGTNDGLALINVVIENLGVIYGTTLDESGYVDLSMDTLKKTFDSVGMINTTIEKTSVDFAGATRSAFEVYGEKDGISVYEKGICIKKGNYMAVITLCSYTKDITDDLAKLFYSL